MLPLKTQLRRIAAIVWSERRLYLTGLPFVVLSIGTGLAYPQVVRLVIDEGLQRGHVARLNQLALILVAILLVEAVATFARDYCFNLAAEHVGSRLRRRMFETLLRQDVQFFDRRETGEITTRLAADVPPLQWMLGEELADALRFSVIVVCGIGLLMYTSPPLTLVTLLAIPPIVGGALVLGRRVRALSSEVQRAQADAGAAAAEVIGGIRTVRAFSREEVEAERYARQSTRALDFSRRKIIAAALLAALSFVAGECAAVLAIWVGGHLIAAGTLTTGALISFILYALLVARGFRNASRFSAELLRAVGATEWIFDLLGRTPIIPLDGGARPADLDGSIALEGVRFRYPARPEVEALKGIDLRIAPGEVVAIVGQSGSGKSTLLNLILRFYDPDEGRVLVGGHDVRELDPAWFRGHMATVLQDPTLFSRTIAENILYGAGGPGGSGGSGGSGGAGRDDERIRAAAALVRADEFIDRLPGGYDAPIGERGVQLSGGQRQRLAIARAVLRRPRILILDEATSALDPQLESIVQIALGTIDDRPTTIIIAHRLSTVASVDRVVVLDHGRIAEIGTHDGLLQNSAFYRQLVMTQLVEQ